MNIYILDEGFNTIEVIDDFEYLVWDTAFYKKGFFEFKIPISRLDSVTKGLYVYRYDSLYTGRINAYSIDGTMVVVSGCFLEGLLDFCVDTSGEELTGAVETAMFTLVRNNLAQGRAISNLKLGVDKKRGGVGTFSAFGVSLAKYFYTLAETYDLSYNITLNPEEKTITFNVIEGLNRTQSQNKNEWCIFSGEFGNVNSEYYETNTDFPNVAYVYGENKSDANGTPLTRLSVTVDTSAGSERREIFVDAGSIKQEMGVSDSAYKELLRQRGLEKLSEVGRYETIDFVVDPCADMPYSLGDICTYKHMVTGKIYELRVTEIKETHEKNGAKRNIVLGRYNLGVVETMKKGAIN